MTVHHVKLQNTAGFDLYFLSTIMFSINYTEYQNFLLQIADDSRSSLLTLASDSRLLKYGIGVLVNAPTLVLVLQNDTFKMLLVYMNIALKAHIINN